MEKKDAITIVELVLLIGISLSLGLLVDRIYQSYTSKNENCTLNESSKEYNGLFIPGNNSKIQALEIARQYDEYGVWIAINIKNDTYKEALESCNHECGHYAFSEIFARGCEMDYTKCLDELKNFSVYSNNLKGG